MKCENHSEIKTGYCSHVLYHAQLLSSFSFNKWLCSFAIKANGSVYCDYRNIE